MPPDIARLWDELARAEAAARRTSEARRSLPDDSDPALITTAIARWVQAAEHLHRVRVRLKDALGLNLAGAGKRGCARVDSEKVSRQSRERPRLVANSKGPS